MANSTCYDSGPPSRLRALLNKSDFCRESKLVPLPVYGGLCHAPHIYNSDSVKSIVYSNGLDMIAKGVRPSMPLYSTSTGHPYSSNTASGLYESVISELLTQQICWDRVVEGYGDLVRRSEAQQVSLYAFGRSIPMKDLNTALGLKTTTTMFVDWVLEEVFAGSIPRSTAQSKLAIVGMACRMPGGASVSDGSQR